MEDSSIVRGGQRIRGKHLSLNLIHHRESWCHVIHITDSTYFDKV